jgi:hypothetical protein
MLGGVVACGSGFIDRLFTEPFDAGAAPVASGAHCALAHPPEPPAIPDTSSASFVLLAFDAMRVDNLADSDAAIPAPLGLDLDNACTCPEPDTCTRPGKTPSCDQDGGRDNTIGTLFTTLATALPEFQADYATDRIREGLYTAIVSINGWNLQPDDPVVTVGFYTSRGTEPASPDGGHAQPRFDGTDRWTIDSTSLADGDAAVGKDCSNDKDRPFCAPAHKDEHAYVIGNKLVAHIDNMPIVIVSKADHVELDLVDVTVAADMTPVDGGSNLWTMAGELSGRWPSDQALAVMGSLKDPSTDAGLCLGGSYGLAKAEICGALDIASSPADDHTSKPCNALSGSVIFHAVTAVGGIVTTQVTTPRGCLDFTDTCP